MPRAQTRARLLRVLSAGPRSLGSLWDSIITPLTPYSGTGSKYNSSSSSSSVESLLLDVNESLSECLNIGSNMSSIDSYHKVNSFTRRVTPSQRSLLSMINWCYPLILEICFVAIPFYDCNFLDGFQNRGIVISYTGRVSIYSLLGVIVGMPEAITIQ